MRSHAQLVLVELHVVPRAADLALRGNELEGWSGLLADYVDQALGQFADGFVLMFQGHFSAFRGDGSSDGTALPTD
jgi:hypothetical protein